MRYSPLIGLLAVAAWSAQAEVKLPAIFGDGMVLQCDAPLPVWGTAEPNEVITVKFNEAVVTGTASTSGDWKVTLPAQKATAAGATFEVSGQSAPIVFRDVVVGEVWVCSGQSNMEFNLGRAHNAATELPAAKDTSLRFFQVRKTASLIPMKELTGKWIKCDPNTAPGLTAVGYFFGKDLRAALARPVGLISSNWGGTPAQAWTSLEGLRKDSLLNNYVTEFEANEKRSKEAAGDYPAARKAFDEAMAKWNKEVSPKYQEELKKWAVAAKEAQGANQPLPPKPLPAVEIPKVPFPPDGGGGGPGNLFNGMIAPLIPYAIRGVIWYQGEANAGRPAEYETLFPALIKDWRAHWGQRDFPFLFVQLAGFTASPVQAWPYLREAQRKTLAVPNTGMAVAFDVGDPTDIHPKDKLDVGQRLAAIALKEVYGGKALDGGPVVRGSQKAGAEMRIEFDHTGGGLVIGSAPWRPDGLKPLPTDELLGFVVADEKNQWHQAKARIEGNAVVVSSAEVVNPTAVRYAWANYPQGNLYNKEGFPASPFRTDEIPFDPKTARPVGK